MAFRRARFPFPRSTLPDVSGTACLSATLFKEGIDIWLVQVLFEHAILKTTEIHVKVADSALRSALEPADIFGVRYVSKAGRYLSGQIW